MRGESVGGGGGGGEDYDGSGDGRFGGGREENDAGGGRGKRKRKFGDGEQLQQEERAEVLGNAMKTRGGDGVRQGVEIVEEGQDAGEPARVAAAVGPAQGADEWQDRENYDLGQDEDEVDVGNAQRSAGVGGEDVEETVGMEGPDGQVVDARAVAGPGDEGEGRSAVVDPNVVQGSGGSKMDKAERKRLKKEKSKREKKTARPG